MTLQIEGQRFGRLVAACRVGSNARKKSIWLFICDCGNEVELAATIVVNGHTSSCGCFRLDRLRESIGLNLVGQKFGRLLVLSECGRDSDGAITWNCVCDCGNHCVVTGKRMKSGNTTSCGCRKAEAGMENIQRRKIDYAGRRYGKLVVIGESGKTASGIKRLLCRCDCGGIRAVPQNSLTSGKAISCGCATGGPKDHPLMPIKARMYSAVRCNIRRAKRKGACGYFTEEQVFELNSRQRGRCACCHEVLGDNFHRDHIVPLALGGDNNIGNIQLLCPICNSKKGAKDPYKWANQIGKLL